jgi:hypothetical protein
MTTTVLRDNIPRMAPCISVNLFGNPCPYTATIGDYCVLHAGGWDYFKDNVAMLWSVRGHLTTLIGIVTGLGGILGSSKINVMVEGKARVLDLDEMKDSAETVIRMLDIVGEEDLKNVLEDVGGTVVRLHEDITLIFQHLAKSYQPSQTSVEETAGSETA